MLADKFFLFGVRIANIGMPGEQDFYEKTKTQVLNIIVACGLPINFYFGIINLVQQKTALSVINFLLFIGAFLILIINRYRKFLFGRLVLTILASILFTTSAIFFRNGNEYYLLVNLIIIIIYFSEKTILIAISLINCLLFIGVKVFLSTQIVYDTVPFGRVIFNIVWALVTMVFALLFFKREQLAYQKQVEDKNRELQQLNDTKEKLFSIIAHDLRSPIGQLRNSLDLVNKEYISPEKFIEISTKLSTEVDQLQGTLDNLLKWSISQLKGIQVNPERTGLEMVLEKKFILFKQKMEQKNISLQVEGVNQSILVDPDHLRLVLRNLISNAIKYSYRNSTIIIRSYTKGQKVFIEVVDKGAGMGEKISSGIFDPENFMSNTGTENEKGTGLGLKLCKEFIEKNNGQIWVESKENEGTTFYISLPEAK